ncbi:hypothetical protein T459_29161 [Capsicum annuum]|uniref:Retrovirus-related Pol polyprotein from transposon TNT 1-94 n=1 Tax=Capsicum annuum TaxID=4072 RepID=A0A2G2Y4Q1_CAPAN|nr:hypothetical protein T459_29161 [Capsicum annuum]
MELVPYASVVGSLMYAMVCTRPKIAHAVGVVSSTSLCFGNGKVILQGFIDADLGRDVDSSKSTSEYIYTIGGTAVSWMSRLQKCVSLLSTEAEYMELTEAGKEMIWLAYYLEELGKKQPEKILYIDSQSTIQLVKNPVYHSKMKHIRRRHHFTRRAVEDGDMYLEKIEGAKNLTDMLTKCVDVGKLRLCKTLVGLL